MPAVSPAALSEAELDAIIDWLRAAPRPTTGEGLYARFCGNCHGVGGGGGLVREDLGEAASEGAGEIREKVREGEGRVERADIGEYMPRFSEAELSDDEVVEIAEYLASTSGSRGSDHEADEGSEDEHEDEDED